MDTASRKRVTLRDVAKAAGVAPATVSYVINNVQNQKLRPETRERVLQAVNDLGYIPDANARTMRGGKSFCAGVVINKDLAVPRFAQTLQGIQKGLDQAGYSLLLCTARRQADGPADYIRAYMERRIDGVIFLGKDNEGPDRAGLAAIRSKHIPLVVYDCQMKPGTYSSVDLDYEGGARFLVERILEKHPGKLLYLRPDIAKAQEEERERGVREAMAQHPDCQLSICTVPVTLENLESWDIRYSV
ncbi:MAG: LacI family DNA-binding transcriptional regulator, partial [Atopobiaceae bacterium]|nr:LacI family DNA-binding transcriptional regulator [Atopobiaceae bacterium]